MNSLVHVTAFTESRWLVLCFEVPKGTKITLNEESSREFQTFHSPGHTAFSCFIITLPYCLYSQCEFQFEILVHITHRVGTAAARPLCDWVSVVATDTVFCFDLPSQLENLNLLLSIPLPRIPSPILIAHFYLIYPYYQHHHVEPFSSGVQEEPYSQDRGTEGETVRQYEGFHR